MRTISTATPLTGVRQTLYNPIPRPEFLSTNAHLCAQDSLQNAASIAGLLLTTDAVVSEIKEKKGAATSAAEWMRWIIDRMQPLKAVHPGQVSLIVKRRDNERCPAVFLRKLQ